MSSETQQKIVSTEILIVPELINFPRKRERFEFAEKTRAAYLLALELTNYGKCQVTTERVKNNEI